MASFCGNAKQQISFCFAWQPSACDCINYRANSFLLCTVDRSIVAVVISESWAMRQHPGCSFEIAFIGLFCNFANKAHSAFATAFVNSC